MELLSSRDRTVVLKADGNYTRFLNMYGSLNYISSKTLKKEARDDAFIRINHSVAVRKDFIEKEEKGNVQLVNGAVFKISHGKIRAWRLQFTVALVRVRENGQTSTACIGGNGERIYKTNKTLDEMTERLNFVRIEERMAIKKDYLEKWQKDFIELVKMRQFTLME